MILTKALLANDYVKFKAGFWYNESWYALEKTL